jgi:5-methylcytosine-specific restriction endonuclease McrA
MLLRDGKAAVRRRYPFTIILKYAVESEVPSAELRIDPGSKVTGIALVGKCQRGDKVLWAANLGHRGHAIREALAKRRALRRGRRNRHTRYREARFDNRTRPKGWLPPSLQSRVDNVEAWARKIARLAPVGAIAIETVRFDTQLLQNPEISGVEYQQGTLAGYEVREYLLEKWGRKCTYCGKEHAPLEIEHIVPRSRGGSNRVSNLDLACNPCNDKKDNRPVEVFLKGKSEVLRKIQAQAKAPLKDAAAVNATRYAIGNAVKASGLPTAFWSGGRTKFNRTAQGYVKDHWIDAACVGEAGGKVNISYGHVPLKITAKGRGTRQVVRTDQYGSPRSKAGRVKRVHGFQTGDMVTLNQPSGKYAGLHTGRLAGVRVTGNFDIKTVAGLKITSRHDRFMVMQKADGYAYTQ